MPSILLINDNKIVSRLLQLSSEKNGYNLEEITKFEPSSDYYDVIFIDSDKYDDVLLGDIESKLKYSKLGYIGTKHETVPEGFDLVIEKPFLPTDFVDLIKEQVIGKVSRSDQEVEEVEGFDLDDETELILDDDSLDLDNLDDEVEELLINDKVEEKIEDEILLDDIEDSIDDIDLSLDPSTVMTTGVATSMAMSENDPEELADMVSQIDEMESDELDDEISMQEDEIESSITDIEKDELVDDIPPLEDESSLDEEPQSLEEMVEESIEDVSNEQQDDKDELSTLTTAATVTAAAGVAASQLFDDTSKEEDIKEEVSELDMDDITNLNERDLKVALGEEVEQEEVIEEIISEEITSDGNGEETVVEMDDMQAWIRDAVQKAITPQMIQEALNGMDIDVTLSFKSRDKGEKES